MVDHAVVERAIAKVDDVFEEVVGFLELVVEECEVLGEREGLDAQFPLGPDAQPVEAGEEPAGSGPLLIGDGAFLFNFV